MTDLAFGNNPVVDQKPKPKLAFGDNPAVLDANAPVAPALAFGDNPTAQQPAQDQTPLTDIFNPTPTPEESMKAFGTATPAPIYDPNITLKQRAQEFLSGVPLAARAAPYMIPGFGETPAAAYTSAALGQAADLGVDAVTGQKRSLSERAISAVTDVVGGRMLQKIAAATAETPKPVAETPQSTPVEPAIPAPSPEVPAASAEMAQNAPKTASVQPISAPPAAVAQGAEDFLKTPIDQMPVARDIAGNLNLKNVNGPEDFKKAQQFIIDQYGGLDAARRGVRPVAMTQDVAAQIAQESGMKPGQLGWKIGKAFNAEEVQAQRIITQKARDDMMTAAQQALGGSDADKIAFKEAYTRYLASQEELAGVTAEAGRALNIFRTIPKSEKLQGAWMKDLLQQGGDPEVVADRLLNVAQIDPSKLPEMARKVGFWDKFNFAYVNLLTSGPQSHLANTGGNAVTSALNQIENFTSAAISKIPFLGSGESTFRDSVAGLKGAAKGMMTGAQEFAREMTGGQQIAGLGKVDQSLANPIGGKIGKVIGTSTKLLSAEDAFFATANYSSELERLATRQAIKDGLTGDALHAAVKQTVAAPSEDLAARAWQMAKKTTFNNKLGGDWLTESGKAAMNYLQKVPQARIIIPFVRTPTNIAKFALERTPAALSFADVRSALAAGGAARDQALARITVGSGIAATAAMLAENGDITGSGPRDPNELARLMETGWQPYSVKIGDKYYSYSRIQPLSMILALGADFAKAKDYMTAGEADKAAALIALSTSRNLLDSTFMSGIRGILDAVADPERSGAKFVASLMSAPIPGVAVQAAHANDPAVKDAQGIMQRAMDKVGASGAPNRVSLYGEDVNRPMVDVGNKPMNFLINFVNPVRVSTETQDKVKLETARLFTKDAEQTLGTPNRQINGIKLDQQQYHDYSVLAGQQAKTALDQIVNQPNWDGLPDGVKRKLISQVVQGFREVAKGQMIQQYPNLALQGAMKQASAFQ